MRFPFSSNEGSYQSDSTLCTQGVLKRWVKQRLTTIVIYEDYVEEQNVSREESGEETHQNTLTT